MKLNKEDEAKKKVVLFQGRKHYYKIKFPETVKGRDDAKKYAKKLAIGAKTQTIVRKVSGVGFCVYVTKTMKRGGKIQKIPPRYKDFNGKRYKIKESYNTEQEALKVAKKCRDKGELARIVCLIEGYTVYTRKK